MANQPTSCLELGICLLYLPAVCSLHRRTAMPCHARFSGSLALQLRRVLACSEEASHFPCRFSPSWGRYCCGSAERSNGGCILFLGVRERGTGFWKSPSLLFISRTLYSERKNWIALDSAAVLPRYQCPYTDPPPVSALRGTGAAKCEGSGFTQCYPRAYIRFSRASVERMSDTGAERHSTALDPRLTHIAMGPPKRGSGGWYSGVRSASQRIVPCVSRVRGAVLCLSVPAPAVS